MEFELHDIEQRLTDQLNSSSRIIFWEDPSRTYEGVIDSLNIEGAHIINVEHCELSSKRRVLRDETSKRFVIYRPGDVPDIHDDFLFDLKLAAMPFACSMEGIWADECGIMPRFAPMLVDHEKFFNSKERKARLAGSRLGKDTENHIRFAMVAACAKVDEDNFRDAVRGIVKKLLCEYGTDKKSLLQQLAEFGLSATLWSAVSSILNYRAPKDAEPSIEDLAFQMLEAMCTPILPEGSVALSSDARRIMEDMARNDATFSFYAKIEDEYAESIEQKIDSALLTLDNLKNLDALRAFDEYILISFADQLAIGSASFRQIETFVTERKHTIWAEKFAYYYETLLAAVRFFEAIELFKSQLSSCTTVRQTFDAYCSQFYVVDSEYRTFTAAYKRLSNGSFKKNLDATKMSLFAEYDDYLIKLTDKWQIYLCEENGAYPPEGIDLQKDFFRSEIEMKFPKAEKEKRIGVIVSDALRYEAGMELARRLNHSRLAGLKERVKVSVKGSLCMIPSYTQLGMAALLPDGVMEIDPQNELVLKDGQPTNGLTNRRKILDSRIGGSVALKAEDVIAYGITGHEDAPVIYVYQNVIDKRGDSRETEGEVFKACVEAFESIERITAELIKAGCKTVLVTADHGFLYQEQSVENYQFAEIPNLDILAKTDGVDMSYSRRYIVSELSLQNDMVIDYVPMQLSLEGDYHIILPRGITRLRLKGSGSRYVHGGASLQENVIPVVTVTTAKQGSRPRQTGVQGFTNGRQIVTGSNVMLDIYQADACSALISPLTVKVGVYAPDDSKKLLSTQEKIIELSSESENSDDRKTLVSLGVTNDIDDYSSVVVRISKKVGATNQFTSVWEETYSVSRAFGNDFDLDF